MRFVLDQDCYGQHAVVTCFELMLSVPTDEGTASAKSRKLRVKTNRTGRKRGSSDSPLQAQQLGSPSLSIAGFDDGEDSSSLFGDAGSMNDFNISESVDLETSQALEREQLLPGRRLPQLDTSSIENNSSPSGVKSQKDLLSQIADDVRTMHSDYRKVANSISAIHANYNSLKDWLSRQEQLTRGILSYQEQLLTTDCKTKDVSNNHLSVPGHQTRVPQKHLQPVSSSLQPSGLADGSTQQTSPRAKNNSSASMCGPDSGVKPIYRIQEDSIHESPYEDEASNNGNQISSALDMGCITGIRLKSEDDRDVRIKPEASVNYLSAALGDSGCASSHLREKRETVIVHESHDAQHLHHAHHVHHHHHGHEEPHNWAERIVAHEAFEYVSACIIFTHSAFIAVYVEYLTVHNSDGHVLFTLFNYILTFCFIGEVLIKALAERKEFIFGEERNWNIFDLSLLALVLMEWCLRFMLAGKNKKKMKTVLKMAEMARTTRILRIFRCLRFSETLQTILVKIFMSIQTLAWVMLLIFIMQGVVAVCFAQGANDHLKGRQLKDDAVLSSLDRQIMKHFGSVGKSYKTCFAAISGGIAWQEVADTLGHLSVVYEIMFSMYVGVIVFVMLNMITGIFINDMMRADSELVEEARWKKVQQISEKLHTIFQKYAGSSERVNVEGFKALANEPVIEGILEEIGMDADVAENLFLLLDENSTGDLTVDQFLSGCMSLRAGSSGLDSKVMLYESRLMRRKFNMFLCSLETAIPGFQLIDGVQEKIPDDGGKFSHHSKISKISRQSTARLDNMVARTSSASFTPAETVMFASPVSKPKLKKNKHVRLINDAFG